MVNHKQKGYPTPVGFDCSDNNLLIGMHHIYFHTGTAYNWGPISMTGTCFAHPQNSQRLSQECQRAILVSLWSLQSASATCLVPHLRADEGSNAPASR